MLHFRNRIDLSHTRPAFEKHQTALQFLKQEARGVSVALAVVLAVILLNMMLNFATPSIENGQENFQSFRLFFYFVETQIFYLVPIFFISAYATAYQNSLFQENLQTDLRSVVSLFAKNKFYPLRVSLFYALPFIIFNYFRQENSPIVWAFLLPMLLFYSTYNNVVIRSLNEGPVFSKVFKRELSFPIFFRFALLIIIVKMVNQLYQIFGLNLIESLGLNIENTPSAQIIFYILSVFTSILTYLALMTHYLVLAMFYYEKSDRGRASSYLDREIDQIGTFRQD